MTSNKHRICLYGLIPYDRGAKARWLLDEMNIPYEMQWLDRDKKEYESAEFLKLNPMGRVPVAKIDDQVIFESSAICAYLADLYLEKGMAPALSSPERSKYQQWMYFASATLDGIQPRIMIIEDIPKGSIQIDKETALQEDLRVALGALDRVLSQNSYLVANRFSAADICVSYPLYWCSLWPELDSVLKEFPRVLAYVEGLKSLPSAIRANVFSYPQN